MVRRVRVLAVVCAAVFAGGTAQAEACLRQHNSVYVQLSISR
jgi:hypothetical protein